MFDVHDHSPIRLRHSHLAHFDTYLIEFLASQENEGRDRDTYGAATADADLCPNGKRYTHDRSRPQVGDSDQQ